VSALRERARAALRPQPAVRYVHPKAVGVRHDDSDHNANVDIAEDSAPN
jgi:hypothetical protein